MVRGLWEVTVVRRLTVVMVARGGCRGGAGARRVIVINRGARVSPLGRNHLRRVRRRGAPRRLRRRGGVRRCAIGARAGSGAPVGEASE